MVRAHMVGYQTNATYVASPMSVVTADNVLNVKNVGVPAYVLTGEFGAFAESAGEAPYVNMANGGHDVMHACLL